MVFFDERGNPISSQRWLKNYERYYFLNGPKHGRKVNGRNQTSPFVEKSVCSLLTSESPLSTPDLVRIMGWKIGLIDHQRSEERQEIIYRQDWPATLSARLQFRTLDFSKSIPALAATMPAILAQLRVDNPQYLFDLAPQLPGFGYVYILTILFFASKGRFPIYDKYAQIAAKAIHEGLRPGAKASYREGQKWRDYERYMGSLTPLAEACPLERKIPQMLIPRPLDRALWVYGHFFQSGRVVTCI